MEKTKVTSEALRKMKVGETKVFKLPDAKALFSGRTVAYRLQHVLRCKFRTEADYNDNLLTITREAI